VRERWKLDLTETGFEEMITQLEVNIKGVFLIPLFSSYISAVFVIFLI
jgi:hypothetical protein